MKKEHKMTYTDSHQSTCKFPMILYFLFLCFLASPWNCFSTICFNFSQLQGAPPYHLCIAWVIVSINSTLKDEVNLVCMLLSLSMLNFSTFSVWTCCILKTSFELIWKWYAAYCLCIFSPQISAPRTELSGYCCSGWSSGSWRVNWCSTCLHREPWLAPQQLPCSRWGLSKMLKDT